MLEIEQGGLVRYVFKDDGCFWVSDTYCKFGGGYDRIIARGDTTVLLSKDRRPNEQESNEARQYEVLEGGSDHLIIMI